MSQRISPFLLMALVWYLSHAPAVGDDYWTYETAYYAYDSGDFTLAADMYKRLARTGDVRAQNDLGFMYLVGQGVEQSDTVAARWFREATRQGSVKAMLHLARMHLAGRGVRKSTMEAHKYFVLAEQLAQDPDQQLVAHSHRYSVGRDLTPDQTASSRQLLCTWWQTHGNRIGSRRKSVPHQLRQCKNP